VNVHRAPDLIDLRRVWAWQPCPWGGGPTGRNAVAWHEAGHAVYARWIGLSMRRAELSDAGGSCIPSPLDAVDLGQPEDATGEIRATAAGLFHAGLAAELLYAGVPWRGPIARPLQDDHGKAERMLAQGGCVRTTPGHAYAQLQALHALSAHWANVCDIANTLLREGEWAPNETDSPAWPDQAAPQGRQTAVRGAPI
jgi:hypothetical protein